MAKNKYATEYPAILKEKAKAAGVKVKKADYHFLDHFMLIQEEAEYPDVKLDLLEESEEIVLNFITYQRAVIQMKMAAHDASEIGFHSNVIRISASLFDTVGKQILAGEFINNYLALQLTIEPVNDDFAISSWTDFFGLIVIKRQLPENVLSTCSVLSSRSTRSTTSYLMRPVRFVW